MSKIPKIDDIVNITIPFSTKKGVFSTIYTGVIQKIFLPFYEIKLKNPEYLQAGYNQDGILISSSNAFSLIYTDIINVLQENIILYLCNRIPLEISDHIKKEWKNVIFTRVDHIKPGKKNRKESKIEYFGFSEINEKNPDVIYFNNKNRFVSIYQNKLPFYFPSETDIFNKEIKKGDLICGTLDSNNYGYYFTKWFVCDEEIYKFIIFLYKKSCIEKKTEIEKYYNYTKKWSNFILFSKLLFGLDEEVPLDYVNFLNNVHNHIQRIK